MAEARLNRAAASPGSSSTIRPATSSTRGQSSLASRGSSSCQSGSFSTRTRSPSTRGSSGRSSRKRVAQPAAMARVNSPVRSGASSGATIVPGSEARAAAAGSGNVRVSHSVMAAG